VLWSWWSGSGRPPPLLIIGGILLVMGSGFLYFGGSDAYREHRLSSEGKLTDGIVIKKVLNQASDNGSSRTSYAVDYTFTTAAGGKITGEDTVDPDIWDQLKEGGPVQIDYAASKPELNQIGPVRNSWGDLVVLGVGSVVWLVGALVTVLGLRARSTAHAGIASRRASAEAHPQADLPPWAKKILTPATVFGGILLFIGAIFLLVGTFNLRQERAFRAEGRTAAGIVLTKSSRVEYNHQNNTQQTHYSVGYRFTTDDGASVRGSEEVNWSGWTSIQERDPVQILYLPRDPSRNRLAADRPALSLRFFSVLGGLLGGAGVLLLGYAALGRARDTLWH